MKPAPTCKQVVRYSRSGNMAYSYFCNQKEFPHFRNKLGHPFRKKEFHPPELAEQRKRVQQDAESW